MNAELSKLEKLCNSVHKRPAMFLPSLSPGQSLQPSVLFASFLQSVFDADSFSIPKEVRLNMLGEHCILHADGCSLHPPKLIDKNVDWNTGANWLEWILQWILPINKERLGYASFIHLVALVCLSDCCQFDISYGTQTHFRQFFVNGTQVSNMILRSREDLPTIAPYIRLSLIPNSIIFGTTHIEPTSAIRNIDKTLANLSPTQYIFNKTTRKLSDNEIGITISII